MASASINTAAAAPTATATGERACTGKREDKPSTVAQSPILPPPPVPAPSTTSLSATPKITHSTAIAAPNPHSNSQSDSHTPALTPQRVASLRGSLPRRRSSFPPPAAAPPNHALPSSSSPHLVAPVQAQLDIFAELGLPELANMWTPVGWDTLLNFDTDHQDGSSNLFDFTPGPSSGSAAAPSGSGSAMARIKSDPGRDRPEAHGHGHGHGGGHSSGGKAIAGPASLEPARMAHGGSDLAWKTILASQVDVEGVGQVGVARVLQEVWKRGGGEQITTQGLWPSIIVSLSLPEVESPGFRLPTPSAHAAPSLQNLYNLTLRHWEPSIFSGLLASFGSQALRGDLDLSAMLGAVAQPPPVAEHVFGVAMTPQKEIDMSQWTTLTPGGGADWSFLNSFDSSSPYHVDSLVKTSGVVPSNLANDARDDRRGSTARSVDDEGIQGLDEILAQMEEGVEARAVAAIQEQIEAAGKLPDLMPSGSSSRKRPAEDSQFSMPTPETDASDTTILSGRGHSSGSNTDRNRGMSFTLVTPPSSNGSPLTASRQIHPRPPGGQSALARPSRNAQLPTPTPSTQELPTIPNGKKKMGMQLDMPLATFVPPPPMCMFFSPAFHDLQQGKVGVWKGDLLVRGKGGGKFSVLIVGETATGHMWQSNVWPTSVVYPPEEQANEDATATATMIPVSHLAREGFTPAAMGMVLCNDANIEAYVQMVQGLHAEGVAFHLRTPNGLPIVFLPAKFDSNDPLQRLGIAFMTKPGMPMPYHPQSMPMTSTSKSAHSAASSSSSSQPGPASADRPTADMPKKKKRRQSAPAGVLPAVKPAGPAGKHKKRESDVGTIPEESTEEKG